MRLNERLAAMPIVVLTTLLACGCGREAPTGDETLLLRPNGDVLSAGSAVHVSDTVAGDVMLVAGEVEYSGVVLGSYLGAGGLQEVSGQVEGSARVAAGTVRFGASVGRNVTLAGGTVHLEDDAVVARNAYLAGGVVRVDGVVRGDLYAGGREVILDGVVEGDARVEAARLRLGPTARIQGELRYRVEDEQASIDEAAVIAERVTVLPGRERDRRSTLAFYLLRVVAFLASGAALIALFPGTASTAKTVMRQRPAASLGWGVLCGLAGPLAVVILAATLVGIPMAFMLTAVYAASLYLAPAVPALWLGDQLRKGTNGAARKDRLRGFLVGGPIVAILIMLPWAGPAFRLVLALLGLGATALAIGAPLRRSEPAVIL